MAYGPRSGPAARTTVGNGVRAAARTPAGDPLVGNFCGKAALPLWADRRPFAKINR